LFLVQTDEIQAILEKEPHWLGLGLKQEMLDYESSLLKQEMLLKAEYQWKYETLGFLTVPEKTKFYSEVLYGSNWLLIKQRDNFVKNVSATFFIILILCLIIH
jgi:hypothetical protein